jgi:hypothetical protein
LSVRRYVGIILCTYPYLIIVLIYLYVYTHCRHQRRTMATSLEQLKKFTTVVADTGDIKRM